VIAAAGHDVVDFLTWPGAALTSGHPGALVTVAGEDLRPEAAVLRCEFSGAVAVLPSAGHRGQPLLSHRRW
jgi:hypothetical protein